ncbi:MAG: HlyD family efflux transporter periplasmic adaptor subunit [Pseudomonadota bacterium]
MKPLILLILLILLGSALFSPGSPLLAHEGEDHDAPPPAATIHLAPRITAVTEEFELVGVWMGSRFLLTLDRYDTNQPVAKARLDVEGAGLQGTAGEIAEGLYALPNPRPWPAGKQALTFTLAAGDSSDLLSASLDLPPDAKTPATAGGAVDEVASPQRLPDGSLFVPKVVQRQWALRTQVAEMAELAVTVALNGKIVPDPNAGGLVQAAQAGRVMPDPQGLPMLGRRVEKGQRLAWIHPTVGAIERGNQQAQLAELEAQLAIAGRKVKRLRQLEGAVPRKEIEAAGLEQSALVKRRAAVAASLNTAEVLTAPVSGVVSAVHVVAGQIVDARETLFEIVDPAHLFVEALTHDPALVTGLADASGQVDGSDNALALQWVGSGRQLREQALPLLFRITTPQPAVVVGQPVQVFAKTPRSFRGVALPAAAVVKNSSGETLVWGHAAPERFVAYPVRFQALDAATLAVTSGIMAGQRVVVDGAGWLAQVR